MLSFLFFSLFDRCNLTFNFIVTCCQGNLEVRITGHKNNYLPLDPNDHKKGKKQQVANSKYVYFTLTVNTVILLVGCVVNLACFF